MKRPLEYPNVYPSDDTDSNRKSGDAKRVRGSGQVCPTSEGDALDKDLSPEADVESVHQEKEEDEDEEEQEEEEEEQDSDSTDDERDESSLDAGAHERAPSIPRRGLDVTQPELASGAQQGVQVNFQAFVESEVKGRLVLDRDCRGGRCLRAAINFEPGEVVLMERAFVVTPRSFSGASALREASRVFADSRSRNIVEQLADGAGGTSSFFDKFDRIASMAGSATQQAWVKHFMRVLNLNAFGYKGKNGLFAVGSLFNHSCNPNAIYMTLPDQKPGIFRALRPILAGEEVTVCYEAKEISVARRRQKLKHERLFECLCDSCLAPDSTRSLVCPVANCDGLVTPCLSKDTFETTWSCNGCNVSCVSEQLPLVAEQLLGDLALDHDAHHEQYPHQHFVATLFVAADLLGPKHWTVRHMAQLLLESAIGRTNRDGRPPGLASRQVIALARLQLAWFKDVAPDAKYRVGSDFVNLMHLSMEALLSVGLKEPAANLAAAVMSDYQAAFGCDDKDAREIQKCASCSTGVLGGSVFAWSRWRDELAELKLDPDDSEHAMPVGPMMSRLRRALEEGRRPPRPSAPLNQAGCPIV